MCIINISYLWLYGKHTPARITYTFLPKHSTQPTSLSPQPSQLQPVVGVSDNDWASFEMNVSSNSSLNSQTHVKDMTPVKFPLRIRVAQLAVGRVSKRVRSHNWVCTYSLENAISEGIIQIFMGEHAPRFIVCVQAHVQHDCNCTYTIDNIDYANHSAKLGYLGHLGIVGGS